MRLPLDVGSANVTLRFERRDVQIKATLGALPSVDRATLLLFRGPHGASRAQGPPLVAYNAHGSFGHAINSDLRIILGRVAPARGLRTTMMKLSASCQRDRAAFQVSEAGQLRSMMSTLAVSRPMCGRLSVGKLEQSLRIAGWCGHVSDLMVRRMVPLAVMPFARFGSRSNSRTRAAWVIVGSPAPAVQPACCISFCSPFPTSLGAVAHAVSLMRFAAPDSVLRSPSLPRSCGRSCWRAPPQRPWSCDGQAVARARAASPRCAQRSGPPPLRRQ